MEMKLLSLILATSLFLAAGHLMKYGQLFAAVQQTSQVFVQQN